MSSNANQTLVMIRASLLSLPRRISVSLSMVFSVALVVCVLAGFLSMAKGFETALRHAGSRTVAVVLGGGTNQETGSEIPSSIIRTLNAMTDDIGVIRNADGTIISSREIVVTVDVNSGQKGGSRTLALRGMEGAGPEIRENVTVPRGRLFTPGSREIVVGDRLAHELGLDVGSTVRLGDGDWTVVGRFSAQGSAFESELWADLDATQAAFDRQGQVQSLRLRLSEPAALTILRAKLDTIAGTPLVGVSEADLYAAQSDQTAELIRLFGWPLALLMAVGATAGALNTMMNSVSDRITDIATVRTLGFSRLSAFMGTWVEAMLLAAVGILCGLALAWLIFNGWQASTIGANNATMAFQLTVTGDVILNSALLGLLIGAIGGALPALAATRIPLIAALQLRA
ncbi:FtsX-like permease family protein (plasmid) [Rhizobium sp. NIBRBAC000502774]|nr:FtsX-like permease family protein [Rhizobium sp. NIBRBAC000502774]